MKNMNLLLSIFLFIASCGEEEPKAQLNTNSLYGTWQLVESYGGGPGYGSWKKVQNGYKITIELNNSFNSSEYTDCSEGIVNFDSVQIIFEYECERLSTGIESHPGAFSYNYLFKDDKLSLNPNFLICDEGCGYRFKKIAEPEQGD